MFGDRGGHDADRSGAGDQDILPEQIEGERRVRRVSERIETGEIVGGNPRIAVPDVRDRNAEVFGERALAVDADPACRVAEMAASGKAVAAAAADDVSLSADQFADLHVVHVASERRDTPDELVSNHHRRMDRLLRPFIPVVDMHIRAADRRLFNFDENIVDSVFRDGDFSERQPRTGLFLD